MPDRKPRISEHQRTALLAVDGGHCVWRRTEFWVDLVDTRTEKAVHASTIGGLTHRRLVRRPPGGDWFGTYPAGLTVDGSRLAEEFRGDEGSDDA
jgi:hypothetical protein